MPVSKSRSKPKKRKAVLTPAQKLKAEVDQAVCESYANLPKESIALEIAEQNTALREHLRNPREYLEICAEIQHDPHIMSIEQYGNALARSRLMTPQQAEYITYRLIAFRTIESWKRIAQTYTFSAQLLDKILTNPTPMLCDASKIILPFSSFYADLGQLPNGEHIGFFANQHRGEPRIDFVFMKGSKICSITLNQSIAVGLPENPQLRDLNDVRYLNFVVASVLRFLSIDDPKIDAQYIDIDNFSHEHLEWRTIITLPDERNTDAPQPHWAQRLDGAITWQSV